MIKPATFGNLKVILTLSDRYSERELSGLLRKDFVRILLLIGEGEVVGFAVVWVFDGEAELHWFEIFKPFRGRGFAKILFGKLLEHLRKEGVEKLLLEVSEKNLPARRVYESFGPALLGRRRNYYPDGSDALVYLFKVGESS